MSAPAPIKPRSPYQRHQKRPRQVSPELRDLQHAEATGDEEAIRRARSAWNAMLRRREREGDR